MSAIARGGWPVGPEPHWEVWPLTYGRARLYLLSGMEVLDSW